MTISQLALETEAALDLPGRRGRFSLLTLALQNHQLPVGSGPASRSRERDSIMPLAFITYRIEVTRALAK